MNNSLYNKNMSKLKDRWPEYIGLLEQYKENDNLYCAVEEAEGNLIPIVHKDAKAYRLASDGHNDDILDIWIDAINMGSFELNMFMFGLGNGMYVRRLLEETADKDMARIIVYEPDICIIKECFGYYDMTDIMNNDRFELIFPKTSELELSDYILRNISYHNIMGVHSSCYINYSRVFNEEYGIYNDQINRSLDMIRASQNMMNVMGQMHYNNTLRNYKYVAGSYSLDSLEKNILKELPVIIVSSGPSLTRNIKELKAAKDRSVICAVDSALGAMDAAGIIPDVYITVDPGKHKDNFSFEWLKNVPVVASITSPEYAFKEGQIHFIVCPLDTYIRDFNDDMQHYFKKWDLRSGGSVACDAFKLFRIMGFHRIILIGQDLAYSNNKAHADAVAYDDDDMSESLIYTDDIHGGKIVTSKTLEAYKNWFEEEIENNKWCEVIDATEGGAYIKGTVISTLREAIENYCAKEYDVHECFNKCERLFEGEKDPEFKDHIRAIPGRMDNIICTAQKVLNNYDKIERLIRKSDKSGKEMLKLLSRNGELTAEIEGDPAYCYINYLNVESNKEVESNINTVDNDVRRDILNVCNLGKTQVRGIIEAARKVRDDYKAIFDEEN